MQQRKLPRLTSLGVARLYLLILGCLLTARGLTDGGFRYPDEPRHALSGVFILDMVREGGFWDPVRYGEEYYARYPALAIPYYAPPFFHSVEAVFFAILGVSAAAARNCVLFFHVGSILVLFEVVRHDYSRRMAFVTALTYMTLPLVLFWSWHVVLETPAVFVALLSSWFLLKYQDDPRLRRAIPWAITLGLAILTKQTAICIVPAHLVSILFHHSPRRRTLIAGGMIVGVPVIAYGLFWLAYSPYHMASLTDGSFFSRFRPQHFLFYLRALPDSVGWTMLVMLAVGVIRSLTSKYRRSVDILFLLWTLLFYVMMVILERQTERYAVFCSPGLAFFAARGIRALWGILGKGSLATVGALALLLPNLSSALVTSPPVVDGYEQAAIAVAQMPGGASVLVDAYWDGDFVFFFRQHARDKRLCLRASKILYTYASYPWIDFQAFVDSKEDIEEMLQRYGVRYVVIEEIDQWNTVPGRQLRELIMTKKFEHRKRIPIVYEGLKGLRSQFLDIYEYVEATTASASSIDLHLPGLDRTIHVPIEAAAPQKK